jgi:competence protein ComGC
MSPITPVRGKRRASSLIELLVVVMLIAILAAAVIPSLRRSMIMARSTVCKHNLYQLGHSLALYRIDNDGWLPMNEVVTTPMSTSGSPSVWFLKLYPLYMPDPVVLTCPEDPYGYRMLAVDDVLNEPNVEDYLSYGLNSFILTAGGGHIADLDRHRPTRPLETILAADLGPDQLNAPLSSLTPGTLIGPDRNDGLLAWDDDWDPFTNPTPTPWVTTRHAGAINILDIDGGIHTAQTKNLLQGPIQQTYPDCAAGGCTLCLHLNYYHYSLAKDRLYWWTGPAPTP